MMRNANESRQTLHWPLLTHVTRQITDTRTEIEWLHTLCKRKGDTQAPATKKAR